MSFDAFFEAISTHSIRAERNFELARTNTFRIGGTCSVAVFPNSEVQLCEAVRLADQYELPLCVMGRGSNCLVYDGYIEKVIVFKIGRAHV